ncbi:UNVERIFIED_CONTAM: hypothetical protein NCL1_22921 [Trichonephila clavipes]
MISSKMTILSDMLHSERPSKFNEEPLKALLELYQIHKRSTSIQGVAKFDRLIQRGDSRQHVDDKSPQNTGSQNDFTVSIVKSKYFRQY